jgi:hypothetical protein
MSALLQIRNPSTGTYRVCVLENYIRQNIGHVCLHEGPASECWKRAFYHMQTLCFSAVRTGSMKSFLDKYPDVSVQLVLIGGVLEALRFNIGFYVAPYGKFVTLYNHPGVQK